MAESFLHRTRRAVWRAAAVAVLLSLLLSPAAGPQPAQAAPAAQEQGLCRLLPEGTYVEADTPTQCTMQYEQADRSTYTIELRLASSPYDAYWFLAPKPDDCAVGADTGYASCFPLDIGDEAPPEYGHSYKGVEYSQLSSNDAGAAWTRGCYFLGGHTWSLALNPQIKDTMMRALSTLDAQLTTSACPGCADPNACRGTGTGSGGGTGSGSGSGTGGTATSPCGAGVPAPAGPFAVSGYGCQYEEAIDGVTCQAAVVNACPDADLWYKWSIDGVPYQGYILDVFDPAQLGLCAGTHTVTVTATDARNNLNATGMSWTFTSTQGPPCGGAAGGSLTLTGPDCSYLETEDRILCTVQVADAPAGADIVYEWKWDGAVVPGATGAMLDMLVTQLDGMVHTVSVTARDQVSGKVSAVASAGVQVGGGGRLQIQTGTGAATLGGRPLSPGEKLVFTPNATVAKILADCPLLGMVLLFNMRYAATLEQVERGTIPAEAVVASLEIDCARLKAQSETPQKIASVGDPAGFLPAQEAPEDLPVQIRVEMLGGPLRLEAVSDQVLIDVQTSEASIRSAGQNDFGVAFDGQTGDTTVAVYGGAVEVYSMGSALQIAALRAGEQVTVSSGQVSEVTRVTKDSGGSRSLLIGLGCLAGIALLAAVVVWALVRSRKRKRVAPGEAPTSLAAPVQVSRQKGPPKVRVVPATGPRLVLVAGKATPVSVSLTGAPATIGSDPSSTLVVDDLLVAERHAQVSLQGRFWVVEDLGSPSGTFLAGVRIQRQALRPGDRIQVGRTVIQFLV